jgi:hypothetical protein
MYCQRCFWEFNSKERVYTCLFGKLEHVSDDA